MCIEEYNECHNETQNQSQIQKQTQPNLGDQSEEGMLRRMELNASLMELTRCILMVCCGGYWFLVYLFVTYFSFVYLLSMNILYRS